MTPIEIHELNDAAVKYARAALDACVRPAAV
jgi:hypothetical protein